MRGTEDYLWIWFGTVVYSEFWGAFFIRASHGQGFVVNLLGCRYASEPVKKTV